jgi:hypothetical protein
MTAPAKQRYSPQLFAPGIGDFDVDNNVPISHADLTKLDSELISREDRTNEFDIISIERKSKYWSWNRILL